MTKQGLLTLVSPGDRFRKELFCNTVFSNILHFYLPIQVDKSYRDQKLKSTAYYFQIFQGNFDKTTKVIGWFPEPMTCRYVRLYPHTWYNYMCLRMDIVKANCP